MQLTPFEVRTPVGAFAENGTYSELVAGSGLTKPPDRATRLARSRHPRSWTLVAHARAARHIVSFRPSVELAKVGGHEPVDELRHASAMTCARHEVGALFDIGQGIRHGCGAPAEAQERMVVLRVAHPDYVVGREAELT